MTRDPIVEAAQIAAYIAEHGVTRCPTVRPEDAQVDGMIREIQKRRRVKTKHVGAFVPARLRQRERS